MKPLFQILNWIVSISVPFFLIMTAVRILLNPLFLEFEYRTPNFPPDSFGFSLEDRLHWSKISLDYLLNDSEISFLDNFQLSDGQPLYNQRELSHMVDVKNVVQKTIMTWYILLVFFVAFGFLSWGANFFGEFRHALALGGRITVGAVIAILAAILISFSALFTSFHQIFFKGDTWLFEYSDTLIRLFPMRLWQDAFIWMGVFTLLGAFVLVMLENKYNSGSPDNKK